jgi:chemotaxis signal transduction protein
MIRKVMPRPPLVAVPWTGPSLVGLCHVRGEFLPVLTLDRLLSCTDLQDERFMIVVNETAGPWRGSSGTAVPLSSHTPDGNPEPTARGGPWGILADEVATLAALELSSAPEADGEGGWPSAVTGWATHERGVVRILDPLRFRELAEREPVGS